MKGKIAQFPKPKPSPGPEPGPPAASARLLLREKRLMRIGIRCPESLKGHLDRRAQARETTLSKHLLDLAVRDLEAQRKSGRTLSNAAEEVIRAAELARTGIESDAQRFWVLIRICRFQAAILEGAA